MFAKVSEKYVEVVVQMVWEEDPTRGLIHDEDPIPSQGPKDMWLLLCMDVMM